MRSVPQCIDQIEYGVASCILSHRVCESVATVQQHVVDVNRPMRNNVKRMWSARTHTLILSVHVTPTIYQFRFKPELYCGNYRVLS